MPAIPLYNRRNLLLLAIPVAKFPLKSVAGVLYIFDNIILNMYV